MNGIIVLEGPDACGKTTLQDYLVKEHGAEAIHLTYNEKVAPIMFEYQAAEMQRAIEISANKLVVVDRHWVSEQIYANVFRGGSPWPMMGRMMDRVWRKHAALYIFCLPMSIDEGVARHHVNIDTSHPYNDEQFSRLLDEYLCFYNRYAHRNDFYSYRIEDEGRDMQTFTADALQCVKWLRDSQYRGALNVKDQNILGHISQAKVVFVGERVNQKDNPRTWPFFEHRECSLLFAQVLDELNIDEEHIMITNAYNPDGSLCWHASNLYKQHAIRPIALGHLAEAGLRKMGFTREEYTRIIHPQFARRFNQKPRFANEVYSAIYGREIEVPDED